MVKYTSPQEFIRCKTKINPNTDCWEWAGCLSETGYAKIKSYNYGKIYKCTGAHQLAYLAFVGDWDRTKKLRICHKCDNRKCCNPEHLYLGTNSQNMIDKVRAGTSNRGERQGRSKLTEKEIIEIRNDTLHNPTELAIIYNISRNHIYTIRNNRTWKHILV